MVSFPTWLISFAEKIPVFDSSQTEEVVRCFNQQSKTDDYWPEERLKRWELRKAQPKGYENEDPHDSWFPISFDENGEISSGEISQQYRYAHNYPVLKEAAEVAAQTLAKKMHWENQTHLMGISFVQHQMMPGQEYKMDFHQDDSRYTFVILLNDEKGWRGGDLRFRSLSYQWIQQTVHYQQGYGILFANEGKQHAFTTMTSLSSQMVDRTILTIHEKPPPISESSQQKTAGRIRALWAAFLRQIRAYLVQRLNILSNSF